VGGVPELFDVFWVLGASLQGSPTPFRAEELIKAYRALGGTFEFDEQKRNELHADLLEAFGFADPEPVADAGSRGAVLSRPDVLIAAASAQNVWRRHLVSVAWSDGVPSVPPESEVAGCLAGWLVVIAALRASGVQFSLNTFHRVHTNQIVNANVDAYVLGCISLDVAVETAIWSELASRPTGSTLSVEGAPDAHRPFLFAIAMVGALTAKAHLRAEKLGEPDRPRRTYRRLVRATPSADGLDPGSTDDRRYKLVQVTVDQRRH